MHGVQVLRLITSGHRDTHKLLTLEHSAGYGRGILHGGEKAQRDVEPAGFYERDTHSCRVSDQQAFALSPQL